jgi:hypothetical protein
MVQRRLLTCADSSLDGIFHENKDALWLHLSLLDSPRDKFSVLWRRLVPMRLPPLDAHWIQDSVSDGPKGHRGPLRKEIKYFNWFVSRAAFHLRILLPTLWRGLRWW